jgi:hypothetical protein
MKEQVLVIAAADEAHLGHIRCIAGLQVAVRQDQIWVRGILDDNEVDLRIRQMPALHRFVVSQNDQLFLPNGQTPVAYLPRLEWKLILQFLPVEWPVSAYTAVSDEKLKVELVQSGKEENPVVLRCSLSDFQIWADSAPEVRIKCLKFVADREGSVRVMGHPLPTIPGTSFWSCEGLLLPSGFTLKFSILAPALLQRCNPEGDSLVFLQADGSWERIPLALFVAASRSGIRQTPLIES